MAPTRFGTDGVRGVANEELTPELALALGRAAARVLPAPTFVVGRDTRRSGPLLQAAFSAGLAAEGADVVDLGVLPTPGVAAVAESPPGARCRDLGLAQPLRRQRDQALQPARDEAAGRRSRARSSASSTPSWPTRTARPAVRPATAWGASAPTPVPSTLYRAHLVRTLEGRRLDGLRIVVDCANGAASAIAPRCWPSCGAHGHRAARRARRGEHQRQVRLDRSRASWRGRSWRTGPTSAWPSTATPTGSSRSTTTGPSSTATCCWRSSPSTWPSGASWPATPWRSPS